MISQSPLACFWQTTGSVQRFSWIVTAMFALGAACGGEDSTLDPALEEAPPPDCGYAPRPGPLALLGEDLRLGSLQVGPCGQVLHDELVPDVGQRTWLVAADYGEAQTLSEERVRASFSPDGRLVVHVGETWVRVVDLADGRETEVAAAEGEVLWLRRGEALLPLVCAEGEARIVEADGRIEAVADDVFSCEAVAGDLGASGVAPPGSAPVLVYRSTLGPLMWLNAETGRRTFLDAVDFADEAFALEEVARNDRTLLSKDGRVLVHQRMWRRPFSGFAPEAWATLYDTATGEMIGSVRTRPDWQSARPIAAPGSGHVMAFDAGDRLSVLTEGLRLIWYEGLEAAEIPVEGRLLVREDESGDVFLLDARTGTRTRTLVEGARSLRQAVLSEDGGTVAIPIREEVCRSERWCGPTTVLALWNRGRPLAMRARGQGNLSVHWLGADGAMLVSGSIFDGDSDAVVQGLHLFDATGNMLARWHDAGVQGVRAVRGRLLVSLSPLRGVREGRLLLVDLETGGEELIASGENGVRFWTDTALERLVVSEQWNVMEEDYYRARNRVLAGAMP